jgi:hypothetical protein
LQFISPPKWIRLETKALVSGYEMEPINFLSPLWLAKQIIHVKK